MMHSRRPPRRADGSPFLKLAPLARIPRRFKEVPLNPHASAACSLKSGKEAKTSRPVMVQRRHPAIEQLTAAGAAVLHSPINYPPDSCSARFVRASLRTNIPLSWPEQAT
jgi:hypothetical protein